MGGYVDEEKKPTLTAFDGTAPLRLNRLEIEAHYLVPGLLSAYSKVKEAWLCMTKRLINTKAALDDW